MRIPARQGAIVAALVVVVLAGTGCSARPTPDLGGPDPALRGQWVLLDATDAAGSIALANQVISLTIATDATTGGRSTCADYRAHVFGTTDRLWVTTTLSRKMPCALQALQDIEHRYITDLDRVSSSTVDGTLLDLRGPGIDLRYERSQPIDLTEVLGHNWRLTTVSPDSYFGQSGRTPIVVRGATLLITANGLLLGTTECHNFAAFWDQNAGQIVVNHFSSHASGLCTDARAAVDNDLISVLKDGFSVLPGVGEFAIASPRAQIALGFVR